MNSLSPHGYGTFCLFCKTIRFQLGILQTISSNHIYRVTIQVGPNLLLTSKQKFRFGLARPGHARPKRNFCFEVNRRFGPTWMVTLYNVFHYFPLNIDLTSLYISRRPENLLPQVNQFRSPFSRRARVNSYHCLTRSQSVALLIK